MKSLNQYINEVSSDLLKRAHNAQVKRNGGVESNRSRKFAKGAHAALDREMSLDDSISGSERSFDYVDLGLPSGTMWATCNVGATKPEDPGLLFQFGRVDGYRCGDRNNQFRMDDQNKQDTANEYIPLTASGKLYKHRIKDILDLEDDAAHVNMGGAWRMPTGSYNSSTGQYEGEWAELLNNTSHDVVTVNGVQGMLFTSTKPGYEGKQLFIPFMQGSWWNGNWEDCDRSYANVWSSQVHPSNVNSAYTLSCNSSGNARISYSSRSCAFSVRGVFQV